MLSKKCCIKRKRFLIHIIVYYIIIVIVFAVVNWMMFRRNTTSFLISDQLNKYVDRYEFLDPDINLVKFHEDAKDTMPFTIDQFGVILKPNLDKLDSINHALELDGKKLKIYESQLDSLINIASAKRNDSIKLIRDIYLLECKQSINNLEKQISDSDSTDMILEGKFLELAQLKYEYAKKNAEIQSYIINHYGSFILEKLSEQIERKNNDYIRLLTDYQEHEILRKNIVTIIRNKIAVFHNNRINSVSFWDFLYYSLCVSVSVSFGDIAPNNSCTRAIAVIELLFCLALIGVIVDKLNESINKKDEDKYR